MSEPTKPYIFRAHGGRVFHQAEHIKPRSHAGHWSGVALCGAKFREIHVRSDRSKPTCDGCRKRIAERKQLKAAADALRPQ